MREIKMREITDMNEEYEYFDIELEVSKVGGEKKWLAVGPSSGDINQIFEKLKHSKTKHPKNSYRVVGYKKVEIKQNEKHNHIS